MQILEARARGALTAVAVGDALGWPVEDRGGRVGGTAKIVPKFDFESWRRREGGGYGPHEQPIQAGAVSDDTQLTLATARCRLRGESWLQQLSEVELPLWTVYERGGGGATKRAAQTWLRGDAPWSGKERPSNLERYFGAGGNGAAMRCLPHCIWEDSYEDLARSLDLDGAATHGHPRALLGSRAYGWAAWWALRREGRLGYGELVERTIDAVDEWGSPPDLPQSWSSAATAHEQRVATIWREVVDELLALLHTGREGLSRGAIAVDDSVLDRVGVYGRARGAGTVTAAAAIFLASRYATQPQQGLLTAAFARGADTDTLAAMTGGLLGCIAGDEWLWPLAAQVQDAEYIAGLAAALMRREAAKPSPSFTSRARTRLYRWLDEAQVGSTESLEPFGQLAVAEIADRDARTQFVREWELRTAIGQTLYIKRYDKGRDGLPRWRLLAPFEPVREPTESEVAGGTAEHRMRAGLVLGVSDLERARAFYEDIVGLSVTRASSRYVSFGWLALEPSTDPSQLGLADMGHAGSAIRIYVTPESVRRARDTLSEHGLRAATFEREGKAVVRTSDPDGHIVEFWPLNGNAPPVPR